MSERKQIPFLDLVTIHAELREELCQVFNAALDTAGFIGGPMVKDFEEDFARFCETTCCVGVSSGTDALRFALIATGVGPGDAVITVPNSFIATTEAISQTGGRIVFVDVDEATYNIDPEKVREYVETSCDFDASGNLIDKKSGARVKAVVPVHLFGQMADMDAILQLAERYNLSVIEDACQAHGARYFSRKDDRWRNAGSMGMSAAFSFYPGKNLGACGEAGAVTTDDARLAQRVRMLRDHGQDRKYYHELEGYNGRLDAIQAGILRAKLKRLVQWNLARREAARRYNELFGSVEGILAPSEPTWSNAAYHLYVIRVADREGLQKHLSERGIQTGIHYPVPLHLQGAYRHLGYGPGSFPIAEQVSTELLSLPMYPGLRAEQQRDVAGAAVDFVSARRVFSISDPSAAGARGSSAT